MIWRKSVQREMCCGVGGTLLVLSPLFHTSDSGIPHRTEVRRPSALCAVGVTRKAPFRPTSYRGLEHE